MVEDMPPPPPPPPPAEGDGVDGWTAEGWWYYKTRPCKYTILEDTCLNPSCPYAHSKAELRPLKKTLEEEAKEREASKHWQGHHVAIGVLEHAMLWDLPPVGTTDVTCNRASCLGNPFAMRTYAPGEAEPPSDADGWRPLEHEDICNAFAEYLECVLTGDEPDIQRLARRIAKERSMEMSDTWAAQQLQRADVTKAIENVKARLVAGERLRLLCHCRPHVRCHVETLKAFLEKWLSAKHPSLVKTGALEPGELSEFPGSWGPRCGTWSCRRMGRCLDPGNDKLYCTSCWLLQVTWLKNRGLELNAINASEKAGEGTEEKERRLKYLRPLCRFWVKFACKHGDDCYFRHAWKSGEWPTGADAALADDPGEADKDVDMKAEDAASTAADGADVMSARSDAQGV